MTNHGRARAWLVTQNLARGERGKFSKAAHDALRDELAKGNTFSDYPQATTPAPSRGSETGDKPAPRVSNPEDTVYLLPNEYRFPIAEYAAYVVRSGKRVSIGLAECCNTCKVSLVNHACNSPTVWSDEIVTIERKGGNRTAATA